MGSATPRLRHIRFLLPPAEIAFHHAGRQFTAAGVEGYAFGQPSELFDEADPVHAVVVFDQCKGADAAAFFHGHDGFFQRGDGAALVGGVEQVDEIAFDVGGGLAVGDDEDLFVFAVALPEDAAGEL